MKACLLKLWIICKIIFKNKLLRKVTSILKHKIHIRRRILKKNLKLVIVDSTLSHLVLMEC